jgi:hypothetical protein
MNGEAYASDASIDLQLDYELVCKIMDDLGVERQYGGPPNDGLRDRRLDPWSQDHSWGLER